MLSELSKERDREREREREREGELKSVRVVCERGSVRVRERVLEKYGMSVRESEKNVYMYVFVGEIDNLAAYEVTVEIQHTFLSAKKLCRISTVTSYAAKLSIPLHTQANTHIHIFSLSITYLQFNALE